MPKNPDRFFEHYLGDGAYVFMEPYGDVVLYTSNGISEENRVVLGASELESLLNWVEDVKRNTARATELSQ